MSIQKNYPQTIKVPGPILPGSIAVVWIRCGKKNCLCHKDPEQKHGPYYQWSGIIDGKRTSRMIPSKMLKECQTRIRNYEKLCVQIETLKTRAVENAPWNIKPP